MADSFHGGRASRGRMLLSRALEALCVLAFIFAIVLWQSDSTLNAARSFLAGLGIGDAEEEPMLAVAPAQGGSPFGLDLTPTGSVRPVAPLELSPRETGLVRAVATAPGWHAACDGATPAYCTVSQSLALPDEPGLETSWTIEKHPDGLVAVWTTPTDIDRESGMSLMLGAGAPKTVPYASCGRHSCEVRAKLTTSFLQDLRKAGKVRTKIVLQDGRPVTFDFLPEGLDAALVRLGV